MRQPILVFGCAEGREEFPKVEIGIGCFSVQRTSRFMWHMAHAVTMQSAPLSAAPAEWRSPWGHDVRPSDRQKIRSTASRKTSASAAGPPPQRLSITS